MELKQGSHPRTQQTGSCIPQRMHPCQSRLKHEKHPLLHSRYVEHWMGLTEWMAQVLSGFRNMQLRAWVQATRHGVDTGPGVAMRMGLPGAVAQETAHPFSTEAGTQVCAAAALQRLHAHTVLHSR